MGFRNGWRLYLAILTPLVLVPLAVLDDDFIKESDGTIIRPATVRCEFIKLNHLKKNFKCCFN